MTDHTTPAPVARCPHCAGIGTHGHVHVRHGNGGGHNEPCPDAAPELSLSERYTLQRFATSPAAPEQLENDRERYDVAERAPRLPDPSRPGWESYAPLSYRRGELQVEPRGSFFVLTENGITIATRPTVDDAQRTGDRLLELLPIVNELIADEFVASDWRSLERSRELVQVQLAHVVKLAAERMSSAAVELLELAEQLPED